MRGSRNHYSLYKTSRTPRMINNAGHTFLKNCCHFCDVSANPFASATPNPVLDRKSTRLNSSHLGISYAVFCLKKKKKLKIHEILTQKLNYAESVIVINL